METPKANQYVINLFETFNIDKNKLLAKEWRDTFIRFDDRVVEEAWSHIVAECRTKFLPPLKVVYAILRQIKDGQAVEDSVDEFMEEVTPQDRKNQHEYISLLQYTMKAMREGKMSEVEHLQLHADFFKTIGRSEDADALLRVMAERKQDIKKAT